MGNPHVLLLQGRPSVPEAPVAPSEAAQRFAEWVDREDAPAPPLDVIRAEARAMARYLGTLASEVQAYMGELHTGSQRTLEGADLPTVAHGEYTAGFRAGAYAVASEAAKRLSAALEAAQAEARAC